MYKVNFAKITPKGQELSAKVHVSVKENIVHVLILQVEFGGNLLNGMSLLMQYYTP